MGCCCSSSGLGKWTKAEAVSPDDDLSGRCAIVTGANTGIGLQTAKVLAQQGCHVVMACRSAERGAAAVAAVEAQLTPSCTGSVELGSLDLGSLQSVRAFAANFLAPAGRTLHYLILNAGIMAVPSFSTTTDGIERQWGVNHVAHHLLTTLLMDALVASAPSRVVVLTSLAHKWGPAISRDVIPPTAEGYAGGRNYGISKLSNLLFARGLQRRLEGRGVSVYAVHPGVVKTELGRQSCCFKCFYCIGGSCMKSPSQGASSTLYCALRAPTQPLALPSGERPAGDPYTPYFSDCSPATPEPTGLSDTAAETLWVVTEEVLASHSGGPAGAGVPSASQ